MSLKSKPYYWVICDICGVSAQSGDFTAWSDQVVPEDEAEDAGWHCEGGNHVCEDCLVEIPNLEDQ